MSNYDRINIDKFNVNNIDYMLVELFNDFTQSLVLLIHNTYLGDDVLSTSDKIKHFQWCWKQNLNNFKEEGIIFKDRDDVFNYYLEFIFKYFYQIDKDNNEEEIIITIRIIWASIFTINKLKTNKEEKIFLRVYNLLKKSIKTIN